MKNELRNEFKKKFFESLKEAITGSFISDKELEKFSNDVGLALSLNEIQTCVRQIEDRIGSEYKIRLHRVYREGYKVLEATEQYYRAGNETCKKIKQACKKGSKRLSYVNAEKLPQEQRMSLASKKMAFDAISQITDSTAAKNRLERKEVSVLDGAVNELKALEHLKKVGL